MTRAGPARRTSSLLLAAAVCALPGCQLGPGRVPVSSAHYSDAVRVAQSEGLLLNLVRLRYRDPPVYLDVSSISTQFEFGASASVDGTLVESGPDLLGIGAGVDYAERPTVTFGIRGGDDFERSLLQSISGSAVALLAESGWRVDRILRLSVEGLNGLEHGDTASGPTPSRKPRYEPFLEAVTLLQDLRDRDLVRFDYDLRDEPISDPIPRSQLSGEDLIVAAREGVKFRRVGASQDYVPVLQKRHLILRFLEGAGASADVARLRALLRLDPALDRIQVITLDDVDAPRSGDAGPFSQLVVDTRSLLGVLYYLSHAVEPPAEDLRRGVATATTTASGQPFDWNELLGGMFRVRHGPRRPSGAAVAVKHRGSWFYIDDADESSKSSFLLLRHLFALQSGDSPSIKPVLTLPVGQ